MTDLWTIAAADEEAERRDRMIATAVLACTPHFAFAAQAMTRDEFEDRVAIVSDRVEAKVAAATLNHPESFPLVHRAVLDTWSSDFDIVSEGRWAESQRRNAHRAYRRSVATGRTMEVTSKGSTEDHPDDPLIQWGDDQPSDPEGQTEGEWGQKIVDERRKKTASDSFQDDLAKLDKALSDGGWVMTLSDGTKALDPNTPEDLARPYQKLLQWGYANGTIAKRQTVASATKTAGGDFWDLVDALLAKARKAKSVAEVMKIFRVEDNPYGDPNITNAKAFFAGSGGDASLYDALYAAGWTWVKGDDIFWVMKDPNGDLLTYIEGDLYPGDQMGSTAALASIDIESKKSPDLGFGLGQFDASFGFDNRYALGAEGDLSEDHLDFLAAYHEGYSRAMDGSIVRSAVLIGHKVVLAAFPDDLKDDDEKKDEEEGDTDESDSDDDPKSEVSQEAPPVDQPVASSDLDPTQMDVGTKSKMTFVMADGTTGDVEVVFIREENGVYFFNGPTGEFGVANTTGAWQDADGNKFTFVDASGSEEGNDQMDAKEEAQDGGDTTPPPDESASDDEADDKSKKDDPPWAKKSSSPRLAVGDRAPEGEYEKVRDFISQRWDGLYGLNYQGPVPSRGGAPGGRLWKGTLRVPDGDPVFVVIDDSGKMWDMTRGGENDSGSGSFRGSV